jgi:hypothetical protein
MTDMDTGGRVVDDDSVPGGGERPRFWGTDSTPFSRPGENRQPCRVVLRQVDDKNFDLVEPLVYTPPAHVPGAPATPLTIEKRWLRSDLASIPGVLGWFARRHGRHTPAALVHDLLIVEKRPRVGTPDVPVADDRYPIGFPVEWRVAPEVADLLFRHMLLDSGVPPVRAYLMWAGVAFRTRLKSGAARLALTVAWIAVALVGTGLLVWGLAGGRWPLVAVALLAPLAGAALWGRQYAAGAIAGYAVWWALIGAAPAWIAYKLYQLVELAAGVAVPRRDGPPDEPRPGPPPYDAR